MAGAGRRLKDAAVNLALVLISTTAAVLLLELGLHVATGRRFVDVDLRLLSGPLTWVPSQSQRWKRIEWDIDYTINSTGFRDVEWPKEPSKKEKNVVALGDSWTEGYGVELGESYPKRVETRLHEAGVPARVYGAGLQGRAPHDYIKIYDVFFKDRPDIALVTMGFDLSTDIEDPEEPPPSVTPPPTKTFKYYAKRFLCEHSVLYNFVRRPLRLRRGGGLLRRLGLMDQGGGYEPVATNPKYEYRWRYTAEMVASFKKRVEAQGRAFVLILIPMKLQVEDDTNELLLKESQLDASKVSRFGFNDYMKQVCKGMRMTCVDLLQPFREANAKEPHALYFRTDNHWSAKGQALAGETIFEALKARGLVARLRAPAR